MQEIKQDRPSTTNHKTSPTLVENPTSMLTEHIKNNTFIPFEYGNASQDAPHDYEKPSIVPLYTPTLNV